MYLRVTIICRYIFCGLGLKHNLLTLSFKFYDLYAKIVQGQYNNFVLISILKTYMYMYMDIAFFLEYVYNILCIYS